MIKHWSVSWCFRAAFKKTHKLYQPVSYFKTTCFRGFPNALFPGSKCLARNSMDQVSGSPPNLLNHTCFSWSISPQTHPFAVKWPDFWVFLPLWRTVRTSFLVRNMTLVQDRHCGVTKLAMFVSNHSSWGIDDVEGLGVDRLWKPISSSKAYQRPEMYRIKPTTRTRRQLARERERCLSSSSEYSSRLKKW